MGHMGYIFMVCSEPYHRDTFKKSDCALTQLLEFFMLKKITKILIFSIMA